MNPIRVNKAALIAALAAVLTSITAPMTQVAHAGSSDGYISGFSYLDRNLNGKRDAGEPGVFGFYKLTNGGAYYTCGSVGRGSVFSIPVKTGTYYIVPIAIKGFHTTTPIVKVDVKEAGKSYNVEMGFAQDPTAPGDACGQYEPKRVIRPNGLGILETATAAGNFSTLLGALKTAGLVDALNGAGPFTVFAPNDLAFAKFTDEELAEIIADKAKLATVLKFHVVPGNVSANDVVNGATLKTLQGGELKAELIGDEAFVNGAKIVATDIKAANGIIHVIDTVLVP
jgi:hypothetical protein